MNLLKAITPAWAFRLRGQYSADLIETKAAPVIKFPLSMFWNSAGNSHDATEKGELARGTGAYAASALAYSCMRFRATKIVEPPLWIQEETKDGEEWLPSDTDHPLAELLEQPNPDMEMADLLEATMLYTDSTGKCIWVKTRDRGERIARLYPFAGDEFTVEQADGRMYGRFVIQTSTGKKNLAPEDVVFFRNFDPRYTLDGLAPLEAALAHLNIGQNQLRAIKAIMKNAIKPSGTLTYDNKLEEEDEENVKAQLRAFYAGVDNAGKFMLLQQGGKLEKIPNSLDDLALGAVQDDVEANVCSVFQVHPALVGATVALKNSSGLSDSLKPAQTLFYDLCAFPTWARIEKTLTKSLLREVDDNPLRFIRFDKSKVRALQVDLAARVTEATGAANYWTVNERRSHTLQQPLPDDDERGDEIGSAAANPFGDLFSGARAPAKALPPKKREAKEKEAELEPEPEPVETKDKRLELWQKFDERAQGEESAYESAATALFSVERSRIVALFDSGPKGTSGTNGKRPHGLDIRKATLLRASVESYLEDALKKLAESYGREGEYRKAWFERYKELIGRTFKVAGDRLAAEVGFDFDLENPRVQAAIVKRANRLAGNVSETTYQQIKLIVSEGRTQGVGVSAIASEVNTKVFGDMASARATTIARTETVGALNAGELASAAESGVIQSKEWLSQGDARVRDSHAAIDGMRIALDQSFPNGLAHPGDQSGSADEVVNCRCTLLFHDEPAKSKTRPIEEKLSKRIEELEKDRKVEVILPPTPAPRKVTKEITYHGDPITGATVVETYEGAD